MLDKNELDELKERIVKLRLNDQLYLIEMVLAEHPQEVGRSNLRNASTD